MAQRTNLWSRPGWSKHSYGLTASKNSNDYTTVGAPTYEQVAGLRDALLDAGGGDLPKEFEDYSDIVEVLDRTSHNFFDTLGFGPPPQDVEYYHYQEDIDQLVVTVTGGLSQCSGTIYYGRVSGYGTAAATQLLSSVIDTSTVVGMKIRSGHILRNVTRFGPELMLVMDMTNPSTGTNALYVLRAYNMGGRIALDGTDTTTTIQTAATQAHQVGDKLAVVGLVTSEENLAPPSYRTGYDQRFNVLQIVDFANREGFLESLFARKNVPSRFQNPMQHAFDIHQLQFYEVWNRNALYGVRAAQRIMGYTFYATAGILSEIKRYSTSKWSGDTNSIFGGELDFDTTTTWNPYKANGDSNYKYGLGGLTSGADPAEPVVFGEDMLNKLNATVIEKLGTGGKNKQFIPNVIYGPAKFRRVFGAFDKSKFTNMKSNIGVTAGYYCDHYITDMGNTLEYVVEDELIDTVLLGNPGNGQKRSLITMARFTPPTQDRTKQEWFTSIMGFSWMYPEYAWGLWENVTA